ncbi:MAG: hypothetical protein RIS90_2601 [Pseudomonadota bacterium]
MAADVALQHLEAGLGGLGGHHPGTHAGKVTDLLMTNFHLPKRTLMMLVSAFAGHAHIMGLYAHAVRERYRFFSYGDAMLLARAAPHPNRLSTGVTAADEALGEGCKK